MVADQDCNGEALERSTKSDKKVVMAAIEQHGLALEYASADMKSDKDVVMAAVKQHGWSLYFASNELRSSKDVVLAAVRQDPASLKFALGGLNQDRECLAMAGLFDDRYEELNNAHAPRIVMSTKFSLVYSPNSWDKNTCDPKWTNRKHPCRGTFDTCEKPVELKTGVPKEKECCWRYSFRYQLEKAKDTGGFMIQVAEYFWKEDRHILGDGQQIETELAEQVGVKVFRVYESPLNVPNQIDLKGFIDCVESWYEAGGNDTSLVEYRLGEENISVICKPDK